MSLNDLNDQKDLKDLKVSKSFRSEPQSSRKLLTSFQLRFKCYYVWQVFKNYVLRNMIISEKTLYIHYLHAAHQNNIHTMFVGLRQSCRRVHYFCQNNKIST